MPSWIFFNTAPDPDIIVEYTENYSRFSVHLMHPANETGNKVFTAPYEPPVQQLLKTNAGLVIPIEGTGKIKIQLKRSFFKRRLRVCFNHVQLSGLQVA